ncbi:MAG: hypothetical protein R3A13_02845 [Bdellovibrionota bacterium]
MTTNKLRIAWFSPLPVKGKSSGTISEYCTELLLPELNQSFDIELFHNAFEPYQDYKTYHFLNAAKIHDENPFDAFFYQLEDHLALNFIRMHIGLKPGIVWFHDFILSNYGPEPILNSPWEETVKKFKDKDRPWADRDAEYFRDSPIAYREAAYAVVPAFSSVKAAGDYRANKDLALRDNLATASENGPWNLSIPVEIPDSLYNGEAKQIAFCGFPGVEKRAHKLLEAVSKLGSDVKLSWLIDADEEDRALEALRSFGIETAELSIGRSASSWRELVRKSGIAFHCHFSAFGGTREYLPISISEGIPTIVSSYGDGEHLPEDLLFKIDAGTTEATQIELLVRKILAGEVQINRESLKAYALEHNSTQAVALQIESLVAQAKPLLSDCSTSWSKLELQAQSKLAEEAFEIVNDGDTGVLRDFKKKLFGPVFEEFKWVNKNI